MDRVGITIARGGSRRLPRKNARPFCGLPLVAWTIIQLRAAQMVDAVFLSTDDDEIAAIGEEYGAYVIRRPDWPDADQVAANRVYQHAVEYIESRGWEPTVCVQALPTSPLRLVNDFDRAIQMHAEMGAKIVGMARRRETFVYEKVHPLIVRARIMDKFKKYYDIASGNVVVTNWRWYRAFTEGLPSDLDADLDAIMQDVDHVAEQDQYFIELAPWQVWEVDTLEEFETAELLMERFILKGRPWQEVYRQRPGVFPRHGE